MKKVLFALAVSCGFLLLCAIYGETHFRHLAARERPWLVEDHQRRGVSPDDPEIRSALPGLSYRNPPHALDDKGEPTNAWGYHDTEFVVPKPPGTFRIAIVGDSMTYGAAVLESETFSNRLEQILNHRLGGRVFDVANLGVAGYQVLQAYSTLKHIVIPFLQPDLVIYAFSNNDHNDAGFNFYRAGAQYRRLCLDPQQLCPEFRPSQLFVRARLAVWLELESALYAELKYRSEILRYERVLPLVQKAGRSIRGGRARQAFWDGAAMVPYFYPHASDCSVYGLSYVAIRGMRKLASERKMRFMVMNVPVLVEGDCRDCDYAAKGFFDFFTSGNQNIAIYSPHQYMRKELSDRGIRAADTWAGKNDSHPNALGHELIAEGLYEYLSAHEELLD